MDKKEKDKLEDAHNQKVRHFNEIEIALDDYYDKFKVKTEQLLEAIYDAARQVPVSVAQPYLYDIEENLDNYKREWDKNFEDLAEARYQENKAYYEKLDEIERS